MRSAPAEAAGAAALAVAEQQQQRRRGNGGGARVGLCLLCGLPAAGKSSLARALSRRLPQSPGWACALLTYDELIPPEAFRPRAPGAGPHEPSPLVSAAALIGRRGAPVLRHWVWPQLPGNGTRRPRGGAGPGPLRAGMRGRDLSPLSLSLHSCPAGSGAAESCCSAWRDSCGRCSPGRRCPAPRSPAGSASWAAAAGRGCCPPRRVTPEPPPGRFSSCWMTTSITRACATRCTSWPANVIIP